MNMKKPRLKLRTRPKNNAMQHFVFQKALALSIISSLVLQSSVPALADPATRTEAYASPKISVASEVPDQGNLDAYHNVFRDGDAVSNTLYSLRNTAVEDLLNTRKALKILIGGTHRARSVSRDDSVSFEVPASVNRLYHPQMSLPASALAAPSPLNQTVRAINWLANEEPRDNPGLRQRLLTSLIHVSALLAKYDQQIKFIQKDFFQHPALSSQIFEQETLPLFRAALGRSQAEPNLENIARQARRNWMSKHGVDETIAELRGQREYLLNRYHLLSLKLDKIPLYQEIYLALMKEGFPDANLVQKPVSTTLPQGPVPLPTEFETLLNSALDRLAGTELPAEGAALHQRLEKELAPKLDLALIETLRTNSEFLHRLAEKPHHGSERKSPLLELAKDELLWKTAEAKYAYLVQAGHLDMPEAKKRILQHLSEVETTDRRIRYTVYGAGLGLGVVGLVASAGTGAAALGIGAQAWLLGSGLVTTAQASVDYFNSRDVARASRGKFLGGSRFGSASQMIEDQLVSEQNYRAMVMGLVGLGADFALIGLLSKSRALVTVGGKTYVALPKIEAQAIRAQLAKLARRAEVLSPAGKILLELVKRTIEVRVAPGTFRMLEEAIPITARAMGLTSKEVARRLEANPIVGALIQGYRDRVAADPAFLQALLREQGVSVITGVVGEYSARGDRMFNEEAGYASANLIMGELATASIVWIVSPTASGRAKAAATASIQNIFDAKTVKQGAEVFVDKAIPNFLVGYSINAAVAGGLKTLEIQNSDRPWDESSIRDLGAFALAQALYGGTFSAVSSNLRFQAASALRTRIIEPRLGQSPTAKLILTGVSYSNNIIGGWHYVKIAKAIGVEPTIPQEAAYPETEGVYLHIDTQGPSSEAGLLEFLSEDSPL